MPVKFSNSVIFEAGELRELEAASKLRMLTARRVGAEQRKGGQLSGEAVDFLGAIGEAAVHCWFGLPYRVDHSGPDEGWDLEYQGALLSVKTNQFPGRNLVENKQATTKSRAGYYLGIESALAFSESICPIDWHLYGWCTAEEFRNHKRTQSCAPFS